MIVFFFSKYIIVLPVNSYIGFLIHNHRKLSSTAAHEGLVAATVLCTYVFRNLGPEPFHSMSNEELDKITKALARSYEVLSKTRTRSREAGKVADMISLLFAKLDPSASAQQLPVGSIDRPDSQPAIENMPSFFQGMSMLSPDA